MKAPLLRTCCLAALVFLCVNALAAVPATPTEEVKRAVDGILTVLEDSSLDRETQWDQIGAIIRQRFDIEYMSQSVLATNWKKATPEEKRDFVEFFSQYLEDTYRKKIQSYSNEQVQFVGETIRDDRATVETAIITETADIPVLYKMRLNDGNWYAYDVVVEGVSLVRNYRDTFSAIVRSEGMDGLLLNLQGSIDRYKAEQASQ